MGEIGRELSDEEGRYRPVGKSPLLDDCAVDCDSLDKHPWRTKWLSPLIKLKLKLKRNLCECRGRIAVASCWPGCWSETESWPCATRPAPRCTVRWGRQCPCRRPWPNARCRRSAIPIRWQVNLIILIKSGSNKNLLLSITCQTRRRAGRDSSRLLCCWWPIGSGHRRPRRRPRRRRDENETTFSDENIKSPIDTFCGLLQTVALDRLCSSCTHWRRLNVVRSLALMDRAGVCCRQDNDASVNICYVLSRPSVRVARWRPTRRSLAYTRHFVCFPKDEGSAPPPPVYRNCFYLYRRLFCLPPYSHDAQLL